MAESLVALREWAASFPLSSVDPLGTLTAFERDFLFASAGLFLGVAGTRLCARRRSGVIVAPPATVQVPPPPPASLSVRVWRALSVWWRGTPVTHADGSVTILVLRSRAEQLRWWFNMAQIGCLVGAIWWHESLLNYIGSKIGENAVPLAQGMGGGLWISLRPRWWPL